MAAQLSMQEREVISQMHFGGYNRSQIARRLGRHRSSISRELRRNGEENGSYSAVAAQEKARQRRRERPLVRKLDRPETSAYVRRGLSRCWSPDQIAGRSQRDFPRQPRRQLSRQTIYDWIRRQGQHRSHWEQFLRFGGRRRPPHDRRGQIPGQVGIAARPAVINHRRRYGDWEGDTIVGARQSGGIVTLVERKSGFLLTRKVKDRLATRVHHALRQRLEPLPVEARRSVTFDNGKEFSRHQSLARVLHLRTYFAQPGKPWQRGTNENTNGLLRQFVPKGTDLREFSHQQLARITDLINHRPRRHLGYKTPSEVFSKRLGVAFEV